MQIATSNVTSVVLTGGSCAGKSTAMSFLRRKFADRGVRVLCAPEIATQLITGGLEDLPQLAAEDPQRFLAVEQQMLAMQHDLHRRYEQLAATFAPDPVIVLFDRGEKDIAAFVGQDTFTSMLDELRLTTHDVSTSYDAVIHLVTAADGAVEHYNLDNPARTETPEQAIEQDRAIIRAWTGHPHLRIIDNSTDFESKLRRLYAAVAGAAGMPATERERKFLLAAAPDFTSGPLADAVAVDIEQTYLISEEPGVELRVRRRTQHGSSTYYWTRKEPTADPNERVEREAIITAAEYRHLLSTADPSRRPLQKTRYCFAYRSSYCELDVIGRPDGSTVHLLEIEQVHGDDTVHLPDFLQIDREVTSDKRYKSANLATV